MPLVSTRIIQCYRCRAARLQPAPSSSLLRLRSTPRRGRPLLGAPLVRSAGSMSASTKARRDPNTLSNYDGWRTRHTAATFDVVFAEQRLKGRVSLQLESTSEAETDEIVLDSSYLDIAQVTVDGEVSRRHPRPLPDP